MSQSTSGGSQTNQQSDNKSEADQSRQRAGKDEQSSHDHMSRQKAGKDEGAGGGAKQKEQH